MDAKPSQHGGGAGVSLPEDIIFDVLSRLPAKPLCRFRCVSKRWRALISDPAFVAAQKSRAGPLLIGAFNRPKKLVAHTPCGEPRHRYTLELRVMDMNGNILRVVEDVGPRELQRTRLDLVCLDDDDGRFGASAIDPATGRVVRIAAYLDDPTADDYGISFSSFGRAAPSGVYKAVRLRDEFCQIVTLEGGGGAELAWRERPAAPFRVCSCSRSKATVNGVFYFLPFATHIGPPDPDHQNLVASLDLETEEWKTMGFPGLKAEERRDIALAELRGTLGMVQTECSRSNIWFLVDSKKSIWVKKYAIQMPKNWYVFNALEVLVDETIMLLSYAIIREKGPYSARWILHLYDPNTEVHTDLMEMPSEFANPTNFYRGILRTRSASFAVSK